MISCYRCGVNNKDDLVKVVYKKELPNGKIEWLKGHGHKKRAVCKGCVNKTSFLFYCDECEAYTENSPCPRCVERFHRINCNFCGNKLQTVQESTKYRDRFYHKECLKVCDKCSFYSPECINTVYGQICTACSRKIKDLTQCKLCGIYYSIYDVCAKGGHSTECVNKNSNIALRTYQTPIKYKKPDFSYNRNFGIEIEYIGYQLEYPNWQTTWDRSCGYEFVSPILSKEGSSFINQLIEDNKSVVDTNALCSLHVHIDARDKDWKHLQQLCRNFIHLREWIFKHQPRYRTKVPKNPYNKTNYVRTIISEQEQQMYEAKSSEEFWKGYYRSPKASFFAGKYSEHSAIRRGPINLHCWTQSFGTIEFRFSASFFDYDWIYHNIELAQALFNAEKDVFSIEEILPSNQIDYWNIVKSNKFRQYC